MRHQRAHRKELFEFRIFINLFFKIFHTNLYQTKRSFRIHDYYLKIFINLNVRLQIKE